MHDLPLLLAEQTLESPLKLHDMGIGRHHKDTPTESLDLVARHEVRALAHDKVELDLGAVDMTVIVHDDGFDAGTVHIAHNLSNTNGGSQLYCPFFMALKVRTKMRVSRAKLWWRT